jgi:hypothetical protein
LFSNNIRPLFPRGDDKSRRNADERQNACGDDFLLSE